MKSSTRYLSLFLCLLLLTACQQTDKKTSPSSPSSSKRQSKSSSSTSSSEPSSTSTSTSSSTSEPAPEPSTPAAETPTPAGPTLNVTAIQSQDYTSLIGTWQNGEGRTMTFDASGLVDEHFTLKSSDNTVENGILTMAIVPKEGSVGSAMIRFAPSGTVFAMGVDNQPDASDSSKDRLWTGQQDVVSDAAAFYYRVD